MNSTIRSARESRFCSSATSSVSRLTSTVADSALGSTMRGTLPGDGDESDDRIEQGEPDDCGEPNVCLSSSKVAARPLAARRPTDICGIF